jgi:hypothetical protein
MERFWYLEERQIYGFAGILAARKDSWLGLFF